MFLMDINTIKEFWKPNIVNAKAGLEWWNGNAIKYAARELPATDDSIGMRIIERENMIYEGCSALDVGCGGGRFSFAMENMGARVSGTDFSSKMIEEAEKQKLKRTSNVKFSVDNWHTLALHEKSWEKNFDLVLAHMTPAVVSADTFMKLSEASRKWVLMVKPARRNNSVLDQLNTLIDAKADTQALDETVAYAFDLLWLNGYSPKLDYENQIWEMDVPIDKAIDEYTLRIASTHELSVNDKMSIKSYLEKIAIDGVVHETTFTTIVAMYWKVF